MVLTSFNVYFVFGYAYLMCICCKTANWLFWDKVWLFWWRQVGNLALIPLMSSMANWCMGTVRSHDWLVSITSTRIYIGVYSRTFSSKISSSHNCLNNGVTLGPSW